MDFEPTWEDLKRYDDENRALRAEVERLTRERDELLRDIKNGMRVAWALTQETQTVEDMATDLVRQVREARQQRDEARADYERARADFLRCVETQRAAFADAATDADLLRAEAARLREALEGLAGDTPGPDSRPCWCHEPDCQCRNRAWCVTARAAIARAEGRKP